MKTPDKINLADKFGHFSAHWSPKVVAALNGQHVKLVKFCGEFVWHHHENEDELFLVVQGSFRMEFRDPAEGRATRVVELCEGELRVLLFEPAATVNTGSNPGEKTVAALEWI